MYKILRTVLAIIFTLKYSLLKAEILAFENLNLITMEDNKVLYQYRVIIDDDKIVDINAMTQPAQITPNRSIDCTGKYLCRA